MVNFTNIVHCTEARPERAPAALGPWDPGTLGPWEARGRGPGLRTRPTAERRIRGLSVPRGGGDGARGGWGGGAYLYRCWEPRAGAYF